MNNGRFSGIIPPVATILTDDGKLDRDGMETLIDNLIDAGVHGLFFLGTGGEFSQMSISERKDIACFGVEYVRKRVPVLVGTGSSNTREVMELSKHSEEIGADGIIVINPYYWKLTEANLYKHYAEVASSVSIPVMLYNFPQLTGQDISPEFVLRLVKDFPNIIGIKDTVDTAGHIRELIIKVKKERPDFAVFCGYDDHIWNTLSLGGDGAISASGNFAPQLSVGIYNAFQNQDMETGLQLLERLAYIPLMYKLDSPFVNVVKEAIKLCGLDISTYVYPPSHALNKEKLEELRALLIKAKLV